MKIFSDKWMGDNWKNCRNSWLVPVVYLLLLIGFPFFFFGGPGYRAERSFKAAWNLGHILFFFLTTWQVICLFRSSGQGKKSWLFFILVFTGVLMAGGAVEIAQQFTGGRTVDGWDLYRNQLGSLLAFAMTGSLPLCRRKNRWLIFAVAGLILLNTWPLYKALFDEQTAQAQFPLLADFETPFEVTRWNDVRQLRRQREIVRHGDYGLRVQLSTATYSGTSLFYFPHDWRDYRWLHFSVYNPEDEAFQLHCRINDALHSEHGNRFDDRFYTRFELRPGWNDLVISLQEVRTAPATRLMDMARITGFGLFVIRQQHARVLYLDNVYLSR